MLRFTLSVWVPQAEKHRGIEPAAQLLSKLGNFALSVWLPQAEKHQGIEPAPQLSAKKDSTSGSGHPRGAHTRRLAPTPISLAWARLNSTDPEGMACGCMLLRAVRPG